MMGKLSLMVNSMLQTSSPLSVLKRLLLLQNSVMRLVLHFIILKPNSIYNIEREKDCIFMTTCCAPWQQLNYYNIKVGQIFRSWKNVCSK